MQSRRPTLLQRLIRIIDRIATVRVLVLLILLTALFPAVLFPAAGIGNDKPLDLYFSYSPDQVYGYLGGLGAGGRNAYARMELTTDLLFPVVYCLALTVALAIGVRKILPFNNRLGYLYFLPLPVLISDWCENMGLSAVLHAYPDRLDAIIYAASMFTSLKWFFLVLVVFSLGTAGVFTIMRQMRN